MKAVILAAGKGTRLLPLTKDIPKPLIPVNGTPMLEIILRQLKSVGITEVIIVVHHLKGQIMNYCEGSPFGMKVICVEQSVPKGTADAVLQAEPYVQEPFLCLAVDSLFETEILQKLVDSTADGVLTCREVDDPQRYGVLQVAGNQVVDIIEKAENPPTNLANFSIYKFPNEIFSACREIGPSPRGELEITDAIKLLIQSGKKFSFIKSKFVMDVGTPEQLEQAEKLAAKLDLA